MAAQLARERKARLAIMREEHLKGSNKRFKGGPKYVRHSLPVYPNLRAQIIPTTLNQLWVADLTYVRLRSC